MYIGNIVSLCLFYVKCVHGIYTLAVFNYVRLPENIKWYIIDKIIIPNKN